MTSFHSDRMRKIRVSCAAVGVFAHGVAAADAVSGVGLTQSWLAAAWKSGKGRVLSWDAAAWVFIVSNKIFLPYLYPPHAFLFTLLCCTLGVGQQAAALLLLWFKQNHFPVAVSGSPQ